MKTRSSLELCAPLALLVVACAVSIPTLVIAVAWMTFGVCCLGYRTLGDFPTEGVPRKWQRGLRGACLHFYHLAWWPWYMRRELRAFARRSQKFVSGRGSRERGARPGNDGSGKHH